jgi:hypothetical protein
LQIFGVEYMLPRLRFVFAAALIAAFPWILLGSGVITTAQNTPVGEHARAGTGVAVTAGDLRDAQHMHALAFVRRSRELERLRELGNAPLSDWIATPAGLAAPDTAPATNNGPGRRDAAPAPMLAPPPLAEPAREPQVVASLPEPAATIETPTAAAEPAPAGRPVPAAPAATEEAPQAAGDVEPDLSHTDWSKVVPPLPRARTDEENRKIGVRRGRTKRSLFAARTHQLQPSPFATQPNPFGGPPATATTHNPGRNGAVPQ